METREKAIAYAHQNHPKFLAELTELLRIPSISTNVENTQDMQRAAEWLAVHLRALDCTNIQIFPTAKHPVVYGEWLKAGPDKPIVLIYGHYDVQPVDPIELWKSEPFNPIQRGDYLFARGSSDMKGQILAASKAVESIKAVGEFPVNIKFIFEGEEEMGSPNLELFMREHADLLACDLALNPDSGMISADIPTIVYALRGLAYLEILSLRAEHRPPFRFIRWHRRKPRQCALPVGGRDER